MEKTIIVVADDFGFSEACNLGIVKAYKFGIATAFNLMANMPAAADAVELWKKECPKASLSAHINFVSGKPISNPADIPSLVDENGKFYRSSSWKSDNPNDIKCKGNVYPRMEDLYTEALAQLKAFEKLTGRAPIHFDAHSTMTKPMIDAFERLGQKTGIHNPAVQLSNPTRFKQLFELPMNDAKGQSILSRGSTVQDWLDDSWRLMAQKAEVIVMHFHPGYIDKFVLDNTSLTYPRCYDLDTLCSPAVQVWVKQHRIKLAGYDEILA